MNGLSPNLPIKNTLTKHQRIFYYFVAFYPENHRQRVLYQSDRTQWLFEWGRMQSIPRREKGIIELMIEPHRRTG